MIIEMKYHTYLPLSSLATETALKAIRFISALFRWVDDTYKSLLAGGNIKEGFWWITTRFIRSIFEDYLAPERSTSARTSFDSNSQCQRTLIWGGIKGHLDANKMLGKSTKDRPIFVGDYAQ